MGVLVRFEDKYGCYDIADKCFGISINTDPEVEVHKGLTSYNIFKVDSTMKDDSIDKIIFVYDMDRVDQSKTYLDSKSFESRISKLKAEIGDRYIQLYFVPTVFCSETIMLHKIDPSSIDFSTKFSSDNTAKMHFNCLSDILSLIHGDKSDTTYYSHFGKWNSDLNRKENTKIKTKKLGLFWDDGYTIRDAYNNLVQQGFSKYNTTFFKWILGGDITKTDVLLDYNEAIKLQKMFELDILNSISKGDCGFTYNGVNYT